MKEEITLKQIYEKIIQFGTAIDLSSRDQRVSFTNLKTFLFWILAAIIVDVFMSGLSIYIYLNSK